MLSCDYQAGMGYHHLSEDGRIRNGKYVSRAGSIGKQQFLDESHPLDVWSAVLDLRTDTHDALMAFSAMEAEALHRGETPLRFP